MMSRRMSGETASRRGPAPAALRAGDAPDRRPRPAGADEPWTARGVRLATAGACQHARRAGQRQPVHPDGLAVLDPARAAPARPADRVRPGAAPGATLGPLRSGAQVPVNTPLGHSRRCMCGRCRSPPRCRAATEAVRRGGSLLRRADLVCADAADAAGAHPHRAGRQHLARSAAVGGAAAGRFARSDKMERSRSFYSLACCGAAVIAVPFPVPSLRISRHDRTHPTEHSCRDPPERQRRPSAVLRLDHAEPAQGAQRSTMA